MTYIHEIETRFIPLECIGLTKYCPFSCLRGDGIVMNMSFVLGHVGVHDNR